MPYLLLQRIAHVLRGEYRKVRGDARAATQGDELPLIKRQYPLDGYLEFIGKALYQGEVFCRIFIAAMWQIVHNVS